MLISHGPHNIMVSGGLKLMSIVPGGSHGARLKSCIPSSTEYAKNLGALWRYISCLVHIVLVLTIFLHRCSGKSLSVFHRPEMQWFLKYCMDSSTVFTR